MPKHGKIHNPKNLDFPKEFEKILKTMYSTKQKYVEFSNFHWNFLILSKEIQKFLNILSFKMFSEDMLLD